MTVLQAFYLLWIGFILSAGGACGFVAWKTWRLRKRHRVFHYEWMVKTALFVSTVNTGIGIVELLRTNGLVMFDSLTVTQYRGLIATTGVAVALWLQALYLFNKINGSL
jgi:hypothetical protein